VQPPAAARNIEGSVAAIAGHWQQMNCGSNCLSLVIDAQSGYVTRSSNGDPSDVAHAFAASIDAEHGYPAELSPAQYGFVRDNGIAEQHYTLLDGKMTGDGHFSAWFSYLELWEAWCGRQAPMRVDVHGESRYVCAPDIRDEAVDLGKRVLCTSADMDQVCDVAGISGGSAPCVCKADWEAGNPLCSPSYCRCFESGCDANIWAGAQWLDLRVSGEQLLGTWIGGLSGSALSIALMRQNP
jgi:hypothetical protein